MRDPVKDGHQRRSRRDRKLERKSGEPKGERFNEEEKSILANSTSHNEEYAFTYLRERLLGEGYS